MTTIVESRIDAVRLYHQGATVERVVELSALVEGGALPTEVELNRLPLALVDPTVRARIEGLAPAGCELLATDVRVGLFAEPREAARIDPDRERLKEVEREVERLIQLTRQLDVETGRLTRIAVPDRPEGEEGKPPPASPLAARVALEQFTDEAVAGRIEERRGLRKRLKALGEEAAELADRIGRASTAREVKPDELSKTAVIRLVHGGALPSGGRLVLEYFVPGARWAPAYQCRLSRDCTEAEIQLRALVCQRSGEDWTGVRLSLSSASPLSWSELPELSSVRIGRAQRPRPSRGGFRPPPRGGAALFADYDRDRRLSAEQLPPAPDWPAPTLQVEPPVLLSDPQETGGGHGFGAGLLSDHDTGEIEAAMGGAVINELSDDFDSFDGDLDEEEVEAVMAREEAPAPRRAPPPPAMAMAAPAPRPAAGAAPPPPPLAEKRRAKKARFARETRLYDAAAEGELTSGGAEAVVFAHLRLGAAAEDGARGRLQPVETREAYTELLSRASRSVKIDVMNVVARAQRAAAEVASLPMPEGAVGVRRAAGHFDYRYDAEAPVDVESDGSFHSVALGSRVAESSVRYVAVPREERSVYRIAELQNPLAAPMLPGPVEVHVGGEYVLSTALPLVAPTGRVELGLGVEQAIKLARNTTFAERRSGEKVVAMSELEHGITVELRNNLSRPVLCEVRERLPQPAEDAEVVVEEVAVEPAWEAYDQSERGTEIEGGRRWEIEIAAGEARELKATYVVKIYANNELVGGNRREG